jgi:hypothetical protein
MGRTALVLGPGIGGITVAQARRKRLPAGDRVGVVKRERKGGRLVVLTAAPGY